MPLKHSHARARIFLYYWFPILLYCTLIYIQSSYPSPDSIPHLPYIDKALHFAACAVLGALFLRAFNSLRIKDHLRLVMFLSMVLSSLYGISDELHQYYVPMREADIMDALADIAGSVAGVCLYHSLCRHRLF